jgi:hypothetical protein
VTAHRVVACALVLVVASAAGACGGGGRRSHADFLRAAGRICHQANERFERVDIVRPTAARADAALTEILEVGAAAIRDLRKVKPPKGDEREVATWLGTLEQALDEIEYARALVRDGRVARAVAAIGRADVLTVRARALAVALGVDRVCRVPRLLPRD